MRIVTAKQVVLVEPVRIIPPARQQGALYIPATAVQPHPHIGRLACHSPKLHEQYGIEEGDLVVFSLKDTFFEMPFQGAILLVVQTDMISATVELEEGARVIPDREPMPQELAPAFAGDQRRTSPSTPRALSQAELGAEQTNPEAPQPLGRRRHPDGVNWINADGSETMIGLINADQSATFEQAPLSRTAIVGAGNAAALFNINTPDEKTPDEVATLNAKIAAQQERVLNAIAGGTNITVERVAPVADRVIPRSKPTSED